MCLSAPVPGLFGATPDMQEKKTEALGPILSHLATKVLK